MKKKPIWKFTEFWIGILLTIFAIIALMFVMTIDANAQNVTRQGKLFVQNPSTSVMKKDSITLTGYYYVTADGTRYPIYMSSKGKCFIIRTSSKTGKEYRQYLPEITRQLAKK